MAWLQFVLAGLLLCWALLAVTEAPLSFLWEPAVAATEWGHLLALLALVILAIPGWREPPGQVGIGLALLAGALFLSPLARARSVAAQLPGQVEQAFGATAPASLPGAAARSEPLALGDLLGLEAPPELQVTSHSYSREPVELSLDLYLRSEAIRPAPVVIQIHGGSWSGGDNTQLPGINRYLAARGYAVAAINYRLVPAYTFPASLEDVRAAVTWVKAEGPALGLDPSRIVLMGRSAGGHLALLAGYDAPDPSLRGVVAYYPPTDMVWSWEHPADPWVYDSHGVLRAFFEGDPSSKPETYAAASPLEFVTADSAPTLLVHGGRDELVFEAQSERLSKRLSELGVANLHLSLPWASHGCDANMAGPSGQLSVYAIERFLASVMGPGAK
jgi:acetyl esterase/lipase